MELAGISTPSAALVAGLVTSLHCAGMCGPLACMFAPGPRDRSDPQAVATAYHVSRVFGYTLLGAVAGGVGRVPAALLGDGFLRLLPWVLVGFFLTVAFRVDRWLPKPPILGRLRLGLSSCLHGKPRLQVAAIMGLATPVLPCGPLYFLITLSALSGSALRGAEFMLAFGLGTVPLLWVAQAGFGRLRLRLSPLWLGRVQTTVALITALVILWRLQGPGGGEFLCH
ncbi:MAG: sulfite exporter TauE/SafE family protein [Pseudomonadota bacterium]